MSNCLLKTINGAVVIIATVEKSSLEAMLVHFKEPENAKISRIAEPQKVQIIAGSIQLNFSIKKKQKMVVFMIRKAVLKNVFFRVL